MMSSISLTIILVLLNIIGFVCGVLFFVNIRKQGKLSEINARLKRANQLCEFARTRVEFLDKKIYRQETILRHQKEVEELAKAVAIEIEKNKVKEK